jgi:hypothetical protein
MGKMLTVAAALVLAVVGAPLLAALVLAGATVPTAAAGRGDCALAVLAAGEWRPPFMQAYTVSSRGIGWSYHPVFKRWNFHGGQDMSSLPGPGPIVAANTGRVIRAGWDPTGYGNTVDLEHAGSIQTRYAHLAVIDPTIVPGATVAAGSGSGPKAPPAPAPATTCTSRSPSTANASTPSSSCETTTRHSTDGRSRRPRARTAEEQRMPTPWLVDPPW